MVTPLTIDYCLIKCRDWSKSEVKYLHAQTHYDVTFKKNSEYITPVLPNIFIVQTDIIQ